MKNKYYVSDLVSALGHDKASYDFQSENDRQILIPEVNRIGLELVGFAEYVEHKRILIIGNKELAYLKTMSLENIKKSFEILINEQTPCIFTTRNNELPESIKKIIQDFDLSIIKWEGNTSRLLLRLFSILDEWFAPTQMISGTLMSIYGKGVLIKGPSGIGKSEIALELMKKGHNLVSDDSVEIKLYDNQLVGKAPKLIQNMIEIRGVGILDVTQLFGHRIISEEADIDYVIELSKWDNSLTYERVGNNRRLENILGVDIEKITLPVSEGRSMADVIEVSVTNFKLQEKGINVAEDFSNRVIEVLKEKK